MNIFLATSGIDLFGVLIPWPILIIGLIIVVAVIALIVVSVKKSDNGEVPDADTRDVFGDFSGLLTQEDFDVPCDDRMLEMYRTQWIKAAPGDEKDNFLLLYLALKQLNAEQDADENEWTQEQCENRMDEIIAELSEKTGLRLIVEEVDDGEENFEDYFDAEEIEDEEE